jgi:hypothetical protein
MKLNLLPTTVSKGKQAQSAVFFSALIAVAGLLLGGYLNVSSTKALDTAREDQQASIGPANDAFTKSGEADTIMGTPQAVAVIRDAMLAKAMVDHNDVYPKLYESLKPYIPAFFRINSLSATSAGDTANVTVVGTLDTYQQYADLMLAFSRNPAVISISRSGFQSRDEYVPNIDTVDSVGRPRKDTDGPIPDDKLERLAYFQASVQQEGYTGEGNFGTGTDSTRGAMPTASLVTVQMTVKANLQVPDPRLTLTAGAGGAALPTTGMGPGGPPAGMGIPGGRGGGGGGTAAPGAAAGGATTGKKGGKGAADDSSD